MTGVRRKILTAMIQPDLEVEKREAESSGKKEEERKEDERGKGRGEGGKEGEGGRTKETIKRNQEPNKQR